MRGGKGWSVRMKCGQTLQLRKKPALLAVSSERLVASISARHCVQVEIHSHTLFRVGPGAQSRMQDDQEWNSLTASNALFLFASGRGRIHSCFRQQQKQLPAPPPEGRKQHHLRA